MTTSRCKPRIRVVAGLFVRGRRVLVQQRPPHKARGLKWEFPGGKVEPDESDAAALVRECREELGVDVDVGRELWRTVHAYADLTVELILLAATIGADVEAQALDAHRLAWVELHALTGLPFCEADTEFVALLVSGRVELSRLPSG